MLLRYDKIFLRTRGTISKFRHCLLKEYEEIYTRCNNITAAILYNN
jgi:hypothetical protein